MATYEQRLGALRWWGDSMDMNVSVMHHHLPRPKCPICRKSMMLINSPHHKFIGYHCTEHTDVYITSIFLAAAGDIFHEKLRERK
jgi:ssDNA-binding Zn-finger/Zn-ribbon topoisomerase 1